MAKMQLSPTLLQSFKLFTSQTSIHGVRYVNESHTHRFIRVFWLIIFVLSIIGLSYYARGVYVKWKISPDISMTIHLKPIREIPFPAVTICSPVSAKAQYVNYQSAYNHVFDDDNSHFRGLSKDEQKALSAVSQACDSSLSMVFANRIKYPADLDIVNYLNKSSFTTDEALFLCLLINEIKMSCKEMMNRIVTDYGICYSFNMQGYNSIFNGHTMSRDFDLYKRKGIRNIMKANTLFDDEHEKVEWTLGNGYMSSDDNAFPYRIVNDNSIEFVLKIPRSEMQNLCPPLRNSYKVIFHMPSSMPTKFDEYTYASIGSQFFISLNAKHYAHDSGLRKYSPEMRQCYFDGERKLKFFNSYTKAHCDLECLTNFTLRECGCVKFSMPRSSDTPVCDLGRAACYITASRNWPHGDEMSMHLSMPCNCFPPCNDIKYSIQLLDHIDIDGASHRDVIKRIASANNSEVLTGIKVVFEEFLVAERFVFVTYEWQNFIAEIGGLLGLFMGCSLLSVVELFYLCIRGIAQAWILRSKKVHFAGHNRILYNQSPPLVRKPLRRFVPRLYLEHPQK